MLYIVSGFMRCGTSMMMEALEAGGMEAVYSNARTEMMNRRWGGPDFLPNQNYYELDESDYARTAELGRKYDGKLIKILMDGAIRLPPGEYRLIFMTRPPAEIRTSLIAFFNTDVIPDVPKFEASVETAIGILRDRKSFKTVDVVDYRDMLEKPREVLAGLNWPIDVEAAAKVPTREKARFVNA